MKRFSIYVLTTLLAGFAGFIALCWRHLRLLRALAPEVRWDHPAERLRSVLVEGLFQRRMVLRDWRPGLMHAVIFLGFMTLLLRKLQLITVGYVETATFPDLIGGPFAAAGEPKRQGLTLVQRNQGGRMMLRPVALRQVLQITHPRQTALCSRSSKSRHRHTDRQQGRGGFGRRHRSRQANARLLGHPTPGQHHGQREDERPAQIKHASTDSCEPNC